MTENLLQDIEQELSLARTLTAFANTVGGKLWIGVKDNGKIKGCVAQEELYMIEMAADKYCQSPVEFEANIYDLSAAKQLL